MTTKIPSTIQDKATITYGNESVTLYGETATIVNAIAIATTLLVSIALVVKAFR